MIFASDLDRTLIFSDKFIKGEVLETDVQDIERMDVGGTEKIISYITHRGLEQLERLESKCTFIPVTTRSLKQFQRIELFREKIKTKYAITSNGGTVLIDGKVDTKWEFILQKTLGMMELPIDTALEMFSEFEGEPWLKAYKKVDEVFVYCTLYLDHFKPEYIESFRSKLEAKDWDVFIHGAKVYFIPKAVSKGNALRYLIDNYLDEASGRVVAAGDSEMDLEMRSSAHYYYAPRHGEVAEIIKDYDKEALENIYLTDNEGLLACEEILFDIEKKFL